MRSVQIKCQAKNRANAATLTENAGHFPLMREYCLTLFDQENCQQENTHRKKLVFKQLILLNSQINNRAVDQCE